ncbi:hypothetical protein D3C76_667150 [compost metagenome]
MFRAVMRYFGNDALIAIIKAVSLSSLILGVVVYWYSNHQNVVPRPAFNDVAVFRTQ